MINYLQKGEGFSASQLGITGVEVQVEENELLEEMGIEGLNSVIFNGILFVPFDPPDSSQSNGTDILMFKLPAYYLPDEHELWIVVGPNPEIHQDQDAVLELRKKTD